MRDFADRLTLFVDMIKYLRFVGTISKKNGHFGLFLDCPEQTPNDHTVVLDGKEIFKTFNSSFSEVQFNRIIEVYQKDF